MEEEAGDKEPGQEVKPSLNVIKTKYGKTLTA